MRLYNRQMMCALMSRFPLLCGAAFAAAVLFAPAGHAQVAPVPYLNAAGFGFNGNVDTQYWGSAPDEDGFRKGFSLRTYSAPVSGIGSGLALGAQNFNFSGLTSSGAQYGYSFKGAGDMPVTLFGGVTTLRTNDDVFTSLVNPGFERSTPLATSVNAGIEFRPTSNLSLSLSAGYAQSSGTYDSDIRSRLLPGETPIFARPR